MRLNKLEINGFKSFAKKTELDFDSGVTAIVGPNGCGKSNISDAVRWVLGEQSAKALRGSKMEDVIFNGTEQRKPLSFCEVALTFDNADGRLPTDYTEVTVTRRVYRSGDSEYLLNGTGCRLKDIQELLRDTGIGREGYSIISQGKVEEILSNKSGDRRAAFEEAAGVMKYRVRKEESERKLEHTRKNLVRLQDILEELGDRLGPLAEQSETAREYLWLRDELKEIEVNVFLYQYDKLNERIKSIGDTMAELDERLVSEGTVETSLLSACTAAEEKERALGASINELQNRLLQLSAGVESSSGEAKVLDERMANLAKERERLQAQTEDNRNAHAKLLAMLAKTQTDSSEKQAAYDALAEALSAIEADANTVEAAVTEKEELLENQKNSLIEAMNRISDAKSRASRLEAICTSLRERLDAMAEEEDRLHGAGDKLGEEYTQANAHFQELQRDVAAREAARDAAIERLNELTLRFKQAQQQAGEWMRQSEAAQSRIRVLEEMKKAHEGYYASVKNLLSDANGSLELKKRIEGVVAELVTVPAAYEVAVEMSLGSALQNIVTPTEQDAKYVIEHLRSKQYGRATMLPVSVMRARTLSPQERGYCKVPGFIGVASELVRYEERYRGIFENLLGRTVIVADLDAGIAINKQARGAFRIATVKGDIINPGGSMTGGSSQKREFSLIGRGREIEELRNKLKDVARQLTENKSACAALEKSLLDAEQAVKDASARVHTNDVELATQREKVDIIQKYVDENVDKLDKLALERSQIHDDMESIERQTQEAEADQAGLEEGNAATQDDIRRTQALLGELRTQAEAVREKSTAHKVEMAGLEKELHAVQSDMQRMQKEAETLAKGMDRDRAAADDAQAQIKDLQSQAGNLGGRIETGRKDIDQLTEALHAMENERDAHILSISEMRARRDDMTVTLTDLRERRHRAELNQSKAQMELTAMQDRIWEDYELTYENALPLRRQIAITASHVRVDELKRGIRELGDVNISAIEDYKNLRERFETLSTQVEDLTKAETDLQALIADLVATMESEFKKQFTKIQENFSLVFSELFGGGRAELVLSDKSDVLNCDIDIIAQPPGKKLQMLSLLSGGERALTAIALIFAILKLKPTAFCILDEIESALDEVNVSNFANYVRRYAEDTQFILITHRKGSMEVSNAIYGVSMEERGISRVISARFDESMAG